MVRHINTIAIEVVVPVHTEEVARVGGVFINTFVMSCEISRGSANSPKVGSTIFCAAKRVTLLSRDAGSTTVFARPSCSCNAVASRARFREDASVIVTSQVCHL